LLSRLPRQKPLKSSWKGFRVVSSFGHIRDLSKKNLGIDIGNDFKPDYEIPKEKAKVVSELRKAASEAKNIWIASDEDREGEAIAWHLAGVLGLDLSTTRRIVFHEITKDAISSAIENPRRIDMNLVNSQQARRILDRLVGFEYHLFCGNGYNPRFQQEGSSQCRKTDC